MAINSLETDSNKQTITSNVSGSTISNNSKNNSGNNQQQQSTTDTKESNFEYDDNEWDVGGIGDLIIGLDNDIEKSSGTGTQTVNLSSEQNCSNSSSSTSSLSSLSTTPSNTSSNPLGHKTKTSITDQKTIENLSKKLEIKTEKPLNESNESSNHLIIKQISPNIDRKSESEALNKNSPKIELDTKKIAPNSPTSETIANLLPGNMSSNTTNPGPSKAGTKLAIDHQATLDKGLKMKIKRTKPGTKTSEAKHEIVKAEQNGTLSAADDSSSSSSGSSNGNKKVAAQQSNQQQPQPKSPLQLQLPSPQLNLNQQQSQMNATSQQASSSPVLVPTANTTPSNKRTSSGHRRDKARDKPSHSQRDKGSNNSTSNNNTGSNTTTTLPTATTTTNSNSNDIHNNSLPNNDRICNCSHDLNGNSTANNSLQPCGSTTCIRIHTTDPPNIQAIAQRIALPSIQTNSR